MKIPKINDEAEIAFSPGANIFKPMEKTIMKNRVPRVSKMKLELINSSRLDFMPGAKRITAILIPISPRNDNKLIVEKYAVPTPTADVGKKRAASIQNMKPRKDPNMELAIKNPEFT